METSVKARNAQSSAPGSSPAPEHRVNLPGGDWALWRWAALRGAGFPVDMLLALGAPECAGAADAMNAAKKCETDACEAAVVAIQRAVSATGERRPSRKAALRLLQSRAFSGAPARCSTVRTAAAEWETSRSAYGLARERYDEAFAAAARRGLDSIRRIAARSDFREAVAWQNRRALQTGVDPLLRESGTGRRGSKVRQREQLVANYLQRYCAKNDTIGFFGPVGWARIAPGGRAVRVRNGTSLIAKRNLYFESWCIDALVEGFERRQDVLPWIAPRRNCAMYEEDGVARLPFRKPVHLTPAERSLLAACDGERVAKRIAAEMAGDPGVALGSEAEAFDLLESLRERGMVWWKFELPRNLRPEVALRGALARIEDEELKAPLENALDRLEAAFVRIGAAAGDADALSARLGDLETEFNALTGQAATRSAGKTYAGRTLVYEDCVRNAEVELGADVLAETGPALSLVLDSARWLSYAIWYAYEKISRNLYASLARSAGSPQVDFVKFWTQIQLYFFERREEVAAAALSQFQKRWAKILAPPRDRSRLDVSSASLKAAVAKEFSLPRRPRSLTRYQSPDLMIAAKDVEAIGRGDYQVVLGELHAGMNTLGWPLFIEQHPSPDDLFRGVDLDLKEPRVMPIVPKGAFGDVTRVFPALTAPKDYYLAFQTDATQIEGSRYLPIGSLVVEDVDDELILRTRDGQVKLDLLAGLGQLIEYVTASQFKIFDIDEYVPRVAIDRLIICREAWRFSLADATFAFRKEEAERYAYARNWIADHGLPRFVFVRFPGEDKPVYIDFESPVYVEILAKMVRRAVGEDETKTGSFTVAEMLPGIEQTWLPGASGEKYACELRVVAVDQSKDFY